MVTGNKADILFQGTHNVYRVKTVGMITDYDKILAFWSVSLNFCVNYKQHNPKEKDSDSVHTEFIHKSSCLQTVSLP